ncbi:MAG TPA: YraN family protein, partial [Chloroflexota bacterium]|nr:YraN family protein [Chloroflexota bacterium]
VNAPTPTPERTLGDLGEGLAEHYLLEHGASVLARNYRVDGGEADLILWYEGELVAVEVKTRDSSDPESPEEAVRWWQLRRIVHALTCYASDADLLEEHWRVDLMAIVTQDAQVVRLEHIRDIFPP